MTEKTAAAIINKDPVVYAVRNVYTARKCVGKMRYYGWLVRRNDGKIWMIGYDKRVYTLDEVHEEKRPESIEYHLEYRLEVTR